MASLPVRAARTLGRYELVRRIGQGAMGIVYEGVHRSLRRRVAVKVLHGDFTSSQSTRAAERFLREGRAAAQVRHPHIVDVFDFGVEDGVPYLVMELVEGESLSQLLRRENGLSLDRSLELVVPILSAVAELHAAGIIHRDIKPANILLARNGPVPKLADFGVSRFDDESPRLTQSGARIGTPEYMAPELVRAGGRASEQSDQYALGVTLYECATGAKPFTGDTDYELMHAIVHGNPIPPSRVVPALPPGFDDIVMRAMHREPDRRFACVDDLAEALLALAPEALTARHTSEFAPRRSDGLPGSKRARSRAWALWVLAGFGAVVSAAAVFAASRRPDPAPAPSIPRASSLPEAANVPPATVALVVPREAVAVPAASTTEPGARQAPARAPAQRPKPAPSVSSAGSAHVGAPLAPARGENDSPILDVP